MTAKKRRDSKDEASFEGLVDLGSIPPTSGPGAVDVHAASTAVADLPPGLLEELRRAKPADPQATVERRKFEPPPEASRFTDEAPTAPGTGSQRRAAIPDPPEPPPSGGKNGDLLAAVNAALAAAGAAKLEADAAATRDSAPHDDATARMPAFVFPPPVIERARSTPEPIVRRRSRLRAVGLTLMLLLLAAAGAFAGRRFARLR
ncbi:MAG: hypothetical protein KIT84_05005 [Labilithrix sp.]|nr:hypothetical protein [Labilithrix sp.]MCW5810346.1 hypothetical protein [Labilithrix sp.]